MNDLINEIAQVEAENVTLGRKVAALRKSPKLVELEVELLEQPDDEFGPSADINILREKCKQMYGKINSLKETTFSTLPEDNDLRYLALKDDILKKNAQYRACTSFLNVQRKEITGDLETEEKVNEELKAVCAAAEIKLNETVHEKHNKTEVIRRLESKCSKLDRVNSKSWDEMKSFLDEYYPLPDQDAFNKVKKKIPVNDYDDTKLLTLESLKPLKDIVDELIKACVETPNAPYIVMDHQYWPPYIDLLLQVDIALRHPDDWMRIKLMPFHL